jgi:hypothetical protein
MAKIKILIFTFALLLKFLSFSKCNITFSNESGFYSAEFLLTLSTSEENSKIYYTFDGSDPTNSTIAKEYTEPILIKDRSDEPNIYSSYEEEVNTSKSISLGHNYKKPKYLVDKAMVVRAVLKNEKGYSNIIDKTYFVTTGDLLQYQDYTVISLVTNPDNFFGDKGLYVTGIDFVPNKDNLCINCNYGQRGKEWEREVSITIFDKGKKFIEENCGIRIKGASTRYYPQKNFNINFKKKYGKNKIINENLFPENIDFNGNKIINYDSFSLKGVCDEERVRDKFATKLIHNRKLLSTIDMRNSVLFLNGEFWGLYFITEKFSENYFKTHYNIPKNDIIFVKNYKNSIGTEEDVQNLINFMALYSQKDLSNKNFYNEVCDAIDIDSLIEHFAAGLYLGTLDWPSLNFGIWRNNGSKIENNIYSDGKWRFVSFDFDFSIPYDYEDFGIPGEEGYKFNSFEHLELFKDYPPGSLFVALLKNEDFRKKFIKIYEEYANDVMSMNKVEPILDEYYGEISTLFSLSKARWKGTSDSKIENIQSSKNTFHNKNIPLMEKFFENRAKVTLDHMKEYFKKFE